MTHKGSGVATISVNNVTAAALGMFIHTSSQSIGLSITATGTITAELQGVYAYHKGSGAVNVSVANVDANGEVYSPYFPYTDYGRRAVSILNTSSGSDINVTATDKVASGNYVDIYVLNKGSGATTVTATSVSGDTYGIFASNSGSTTDLSITATGTVSGKGEAGIHVGLEEVNFNVGTTTLTGTLAASEVFIALGAELAAADGTSFTGNLTNAGTFTIGNSPGTTTITGNFTQTATGTLPIEIEGSAFDQLIVTGDVTLDGSLEVSILGAVEVGTTTRRIIDGAGTLSGTFSSVSGSDGLLIFNAVTLDTGASDVFLTTTVRTASSLGTLIPNQAAVGDNLIGQLADPTINAGLLALANAIGVTADPTLLAARLHELGPEVTDLGLKYLAQSQNRFAMQMFDAPTSTTLDLGGANLGFDVSPFESVDAHIDNALSLSLGQQSIDMNLVDLVSATQIKQSAEVDFQSLNWSAQITFDAAGETAWPVQPFLQVGMSKTWQDGFSLDSGTASSLVVDEFESLKGMIGIGASLTRQIGEATEISARVAGYQFFGDTQNVFDTRFVSAPSGATFQTAGKEIDQQVRFDDTMTHRFKNGLDLNANIFGEVGGVTSVGGGFTLSMHF